MRLDLGHRWQRTVDGFPRGVRLNQLIRHCPLEYRSHPLSHASGRLGARRPYGCKHRQHIGAAYRINVLVADLGGRVSFEGLNPRPSVASVAPTGFVGFVDGRGGLAECGRRGPALLRYRVPPTPNRLAVVGCSPPRLRQRYGRIPAQADIAPSTANGYPLHPALAALPS